MCSVAVVLDCFSGSHLENWHSIMRQGLINASGTKLQMHGAAHGSGIYLSPVASLSLGYCGLRGGAVLRPVPRVTHDDSDAHSRKNHGGSGACCSVNCDGKVRR